MTRGLKFVMDKRVSLEDLKTFFQGQLVSYNNRPVFVRLIASATAAKVVDLLTQKVIVVEKLDDLQIPMRRIGMVNVMSSVVYVERAPVRKMQMGINNSNANIRQLDVQYPEGKDATVRKVMGFDTVDVGNAYINVYPSLKECLKHNKEFGGAMAFDKQFAIDAENSIFYKRTHVGSLPRNCSTVERIEFVPQYKYLSILLGDAYEKDLATTRPFFA